ncbi:MAG TPA: ATP-binding protein [Firmicutes bacterium]|nr:ATP-binding protein [Bacillota bacterium]
MRLVGDAALLEVLFGFNPWWRTGVVPPESARPVRRFAFFEAWRIMKHPSLRRTVVLSGPRRVGKTTILYQMIAALLQAGTPPQAVLYASLDHPLLKLGGLGRIMDVYRQTTAPEAPELYVFLDEVQYAEEWDRWIKTFYDQNPHLHTVATGSASPVLALKASESGVGRWTTVRVPTLSFYEYLALTGADRPEVNGPVGPQDLVRRQAVDLVRLVHRLSPLQRAFNRYLLLGGFPEIALADDLAFGQRLMREDIVDKVLKRDLTALFGVRNVNDLEKLFLYLCLNSGGILSLETVSRDLGVSRPTVQNYLNLLELGNLIYLSHPAEISGKKALRSRPKAYLADAALRNAVLLRGEEVLSDPGELGLLVETAVYKHFAQYYQAALPRLGYYRDSRTGKELDVVVALPGGHLLAEVKYREGPALGPKDALVELAGAPDCLGAFLLTKRPEDTGFLTAGGKKAILKIPAFAFLYLLGQAQQNLAEGIREASPEEGQH